MEYDNLKTVLIAIFIFVDDFVKLLRSNIKHAIERPNNKKPPKKKRKLSLAEILTLWIFRFFKKSPSWKDFYIHIKNYHLTDFPNLPSYNSFIESINNTSYLAMILLENFMRFFRNNTKEEDLKFVDSTKLEACWIKREFNHKVCKRIAAKSKSSMWWFYWFKLHVICNELMQILDFRITSWNTDDRKWLEMIWNNIFWTIVADAWYLSKSLAEKWKSLWKTLITAVRSSMKKLMTKTQHQLLKMRNKVETVFSVLKLRMWINSTLPRSELWFFSNYIWCITAYQMKKYFDFVFSKPKLA